MDGMPKLTESERRKLEKRQEQLCEAPDTPPRFHLWGGHRFDMDAQRNILLHFIHEKGLDAECVAFIEQHFPDEDDDDGDSDD